MKKLSILLALVMIIAALPMTSISFAATDDTSAECAITLLTDLGIISGMEDESTLTRAEFTDLVIRSLGMPLVQSGYTLPYTDVPSDSPWYYSIYSAYAWGIISEASLFNPDRIITQQEAAKILVKASSYDFLAEAFGGWPVGYTRAAMDKGLFDGVAAEGFTSNDACISVYNLLNCPLPLTEFQNGDVNYKIDSGSTILEIMWNLTKYSGTFTGAQYFGGVSGNGVGEGKTQVDDVVLYKGNYNTDSFYGYDADVYADRNGEIKSVYVYSPEKGQILEIKSSQDIHLKNNVYTYEDLDDERIIEVKIAHDATLVLNGKITPYDEEKLCPEFGTVKLVKESGAYQTVIVDSYREIVVGSVIDSEKIVSDVRDSSNTFVHDERNHKLEIYTTENKKVVFGNLQPGNVLWVYESSDRQSDKIIVCENKIFGEYTGDGAGSIYIDHMSYPITQKAKDSMDDTIVMGAVVECSINHNGDVVYVKASDDSGTYRIGYLVYGKVLGSGMDKTLNVRILTTDGNLRTFVVADKFILNGSGVSGDANSKYSKMPKESDVDTLLTGVVTYSLNSDSELIALNYPDSVSKNFGAQYGLDVKYNNVFHTGCVANDAGGAPDPYIAYKEWLGWLAGLTPVRLIVDNETVNFVVPRVQDYAISDDSDYTVKRFVEYPSGKSFAGYVNNGYTMEKGNLKTSYISSTYTLGSVSQDSVETTTPLAIVSSVSRVINADGMPVTKLTLFSSTDGEFDVYAEDENFFDGLNIQKGDFVKVEYNARNVLSAIVKFMNAKDKEFSITASFDGATGFELANNGAVASNNTGMESLATSYIVSGNILQTQGSFLRVCASNVEPSAFTDSDDLWIFSLDRIKIYKFDTKSETISEISTPDIKSYEATGNSYDRIVIDNNSSQSVYAAYIID